MRKLYNYNLEITKIYLLFSEIAEVNSVIAASHGWTSKFILLTFIVPPQDMIKNKIYYITH